MTFFEKKRNSHYKDTIFFAQKGTKDTMLINSVNLTRGREMEREISIEKMPPSDWLVGKCVKGFA